MATIEQQRTVSDGHENVMTLKDWLIALLLVAIPVVGFVMTLVWAFGGGANVNLRNFSRASLIIITLVLFLYIILFILIGMTVSPYTY